MTVKEPPWLVMEFVFPGQGDARGTPDVGPLRVPQKLAAYWDSYSWVRALGRGQPGSTPGIPGGQAPEQSPQVPCIGLKRGVVPLGLRAG